MKAAVTLASLLISACQGVSDPRPSRPEPARSATAVPSSLAPADALDQLDQRRPVPLLPMMAQHQKQSMRDHLAAVQELIGALAVEDFGHAAQAARRMGYSETMGRMCSHMGAGAPGFTEQALAFHHRADRIAAAAEQRDSAAVLTSLAETLSSCTTCHATYKQKLVDHLPQ